MSREDQHLGVNGIPLRTKEYNTYMYGQLFSNMDTKGIQWGKNSVSNNWCWETGYPHTKEWSHNITLHHVKKLTPNE